MAGTAGDEEREQVASELRRVREGVRERALMEQTSAQLLPAALPVRTPEAMPAAETGALPAPPLRPDLGPVNGLWRTAEAAGGWAWRRLRRLLRPGLRAQQDFNAQQVQFDNAVLDYVEARLAHTHAHYDAVLGVHGRHMGEIDERHLILQEELVAHVHDLVRRVDLVLAASERGRVGQEYALRDLRVRLARLEEKVTGGAAHRE
jgi:hypothetical protein